jgi:hypothetical protein
MTLHGTLLTANAASGRLLPLMPMELPPPGVWPGSVEGGREGNAGFGEGGGCWLWKADEWSGGGGGKGSGKSRWATLE